MHFDFLKYTIIAHFESVCSHIDQKSTIFGTFDANFMWPVILKLNRTHLDVVDLSESDFKWVIALQSRAKIWRREIYFEILVTDQTLVTDFAVLCADFRFWLFYRPLKIELPFLLLNNFYGIGNRYCNSHCIFEVVYKMNHRVPSCTTVFHSV